MYIILQNTYALDHGIVRILFLFFLDHHGFILAAIYIKIDILLNVNIYLQFVYLSVTYNSPIRNTDKFIS